MAESATHARLLRVHGGTRALQRVCVTFTNKKKYKQTNCVHPSFIAAPHNEC